MTCRRFQNTEITALELAKLLSSFLRKIVSSDYRLNVDFKHLLTRIFEEGNVFESISEPFCKISLTAKKLRLSKIIEILKHM